MDAIRDAKQNGLPIVIPAERSGQAEFLFEHGDNFREAIDLLDPDAVKALVRYNVAGDAELNRRSRKQLVLLQDHLRDTNRRFMLELLVPPTAEQSSPHGERFDERAPARADARRDRRARRRRSAPRLVEARGQHRSRRGHGGSGCGLCGRRARLPGARARAGPGQCRALGSGRRTDRGVRWFCGRADAVDRRVRGSRQGRDRRARRPHAGSRPPTWTSRPLTARRRSRSRQTPEQISKSTRSIGRSR